MWDLPSCITLILRFCLWLPYTSYFGIIIFPGGPQVCHEYLISGSNGIPDNKLTATSTWSNSSNQDGHPYRARLFNSGFNFGNGTYLVGGWVAGVNDKQQYIQVLFVNKHTVKWLLKNARSRVSLSALFLSYKF